MELSLKFAWLLLLLVHLPPAAVFFMPSLAQTLYSVSAADAVEIIILHRGALFLVVVLLSLFAMFDPNVRRVGSLCVMVSIIGFLYIYFRAGFPDGAFRTIAAVDFAAVVPLAFVVWHAWFSLR